MSAWCDGKEKFANSNKASKHADSLARAFGQRGMGAYRCTTCGAWHVGHKLKQRNAAKGSRRAAAAPPEGKG